MSILTHNKLLSNTPPSKEQQLKNVTQRIKNLSKETYNQLVNTQRRGIELMWEHPTLTPQEIINELGDDVFKVFHFHGELTEFIVDIANFSEVEVDLKYPTNAFTMNLSAGTVTVTDQPYVIPQ